MSPWRSHRNMFVCCVEHNADDERPFKRVQTRPADSYEGAASGDEEEEEGSPKEPT